MVTWDDVRAMFLEFPGVEVGTSYGTLGFSVRRRFLGREWGNEAGVLVLRLPDAAAQEVLCEDAPEVFFITPHYAGHPSVLVRLAAIEADDLRELIEAAWRAKAPKKLLREYDAAREPAD